MFYDKKEIELKATRLYDSSKVFLSFIDASELFPFIIKLKKLKQNDIMKNYQIVLNEIRDLEKLDLKIVYGEYNFKSIGLQKLPVEVVFDNRDDLLRFISKKNEFNLFVKNYEYILRRYDVLKQLFVLKPKLIIQNIDNWKRLLDICDFFVLEPNPNIYIRELAIKGVDTKFIEKNKSVLDLLLSNILKENQFDKSITILSNYGFEKKYTLKYQLPQVRFRILDDTLYIQGLSDLTLNIDEFSNLEISCENVYIVENQITTLSFPKLAKSLVIFGSGYNVAVLKNVKWLQDKNLYYWGDIDKDGFAILSQARSYFQNIKSIFMDEEIINLFKEFSVEDIKNEKKSKELKNLTPNEQKVYQDLDNFRLEQERIPFDYICNYLK